MKLLFLLLIPMCVLKPNCLAQNFLQKPYLVIEDSISQKTYKIKKKKVFIQTTNDVDAYRDRIIGFMNDSTIITRNHNMLKLSDIRLICFKPLKPKRIFKQVAYFSTAVAEIVMVSYTLKAIAAGPTEGGGTMTAIMLSIGLPPVYVACTELGGVIVQALTPWKSFYKKDIKMYVVQE